MKTIKINLLAILSLTLLWSCGPKITSTVMTDKNLSTYETYAYLPNSSIEAPKGTNQSKDVGEKIINAMNNNMKKAGYTIDRNDPDLLVIINTNYDMEADVDLDRDYYYDYNYAYYPYTIGLPVSPYYNDYYYYRYNDYNGFVDFDVTIDKYTDADMIISLIDKDTKNIIWVGSVDDFTVYQSNASAQVAEYVDNVFEDYPTISSN